MSREENNKLKSKKEEPKRVLPLAFITSLDVTAWSCLHSGQLSRNIMIQETASNYAAIGDISANMNQRERCARGCLIDSPAIFRCGKGALSARQFKQWQAQLLPKAGKITVFAYRDFAPNETA